MTTEKYFNLCEQMGKEPDPEEIPPEYDDFPMDVQKALLIYNKLGDRVYPEIGYLGKDYTQLDTYMDIYEIEDKKIFLEALSRIDAKVIEKSAAALKAERDKLKRASK